MANESGEKDGGEIRVKRILARARQEMGVRDLVMFSMARVWLVVLTIAATFFRLASSAVKKEGSG